MVAPNPGKLLSVNFYERCDVNQHEEEEYELDQIFQFTIKFIKRPFNQSIMYKANQWINQLINSTISQRNERSLHQSTGPTIDQSIDATYPVTKLEHNQVQGVANNIAGLIADTSVRWCLGVIFPGRHQRQRMARRHGTHPLRHSRQRSASPMTTHEICNVRKICCAKLLRMTSWIRKHYLKIYTSVQPRFKKKICKKTVTVV